MCPACREAGKDPPQPVPGYEVIRELGRGGMGVVHLARHVATGRLVAVKLIIPECAAGERAVQMFLREISVLSRLDHPAIVRFHEVGSACGQFFFVMDYVEAVDLPALLAGQSPGPATRTACGVVCQALEGLGHAHELGFVHRDIKPSNLLVSREKRKLRVKLADFGLAKNFEGAGLSGMTRHGDIRGSLAYMPPEQVLDCRHAGPAADLFSAAATLYALLARILAAPLPPGARPVRGHPRRGPAPLVERRPDLPPGLCGRSSRARPQPGGALRLGERNVPGVLPFAKGSP